MCFGLSVFFCMCFLTSVEKNFEISSIAIKQTTLMKHELSACILIPTLAAPPSLVCVIFPASYTII